MAAKNIKQQNNEIEPRSAWLALAVLLLTIFGIVYIAIATPFDQTSVNSAVNSGAAGVNE